MMEISAIGAVSAQNGGVVTQPAVPQGAETAAQGQPAPAEARGQHVQRQNQREAEQEPRNPVPQLLAQQAAVEAGRIALAQADSVRRIDAAEDSDLQVKALRAYEESTHVLEEAKALIDRVVLLPEKGDLSLEASKMAPYGPPSLSAPAAV